MPMEEISNKIESIKILLNDFKSIKPRLESLYKGGYSFIQNMNTLLLTLSDNISDLTEYNSAYNTFVDNLSTMDINHVFKYTFRTFNINMVITDNVNTLFNKYLSPNITKNSSLGSTEINIILSDIDTVYSTYTKYSTTLEALDSSINYKLKTNAVINNTAKVDYKYLENYMDLMDKYTNKTKFGIHLFVMLVQCLYETIHSTNTLYLADNKDKIYRYIETIIDKYKTKAILQSGPSPISFNIFQRYGLIPLSTYMNISDLYTDFTKNIELTKSVKHSKLDKTFIDSIHSNIVTISKLDEHECIRKYVPILGVKTGLIIITNTNTNNISYNLNNLITAKPPPDFKGLSQEFIQQFTIMDYIEADTFKQNIEIIHKSNAEYFVVVEVINTKKGIARFLTHSSSTSRINDVVSYLHNLLVPKHYIRSILSKEFIDIPGSRSAPLITILDEMLENAKEPIEFMESDLPAPHEFRTAIVRRMLTTMKLEDKLYKKTIKDYSTIMEILTGEDIQTEFKNSVDIQYRELLKDKNLTKHDKETTLTYISSLFQSIIKFKRNINESIRHHDWTTNPNELFDNLEKSHLEIADNIKAIITNAILPIITLDGLSDMVISKAMLMDRINNP